MGCLGADAHKAVTAWAWLACKPQTFAEHRRASLRKALLSSAIVPPVHD
jgi:hypothetical protein